MRTTILVILLAASAVLMGAQVIERWRPAVAAGEFYPADAAKLESLIREYMDAAQAPPPEGRLFALVMPHSAWGFSGKIAAHAMKHLQPGQFDRVIVVSPSHYTYFQGCSLPAVQAYLTPFGGTILDGPAIRKLVFSPTFSLHALHFPPKSQRLLIHEKEHGIETVLPFLQAKLGAFKLVPIVIGDLKGPHSQSYDSALVEDVAKTIERVMDERTLLVISTDLTHYGPEFGYAPFEDKALSQVEQMDRRMIDMMFRGDRDGLQKLIEETQVNICGRWGLDILMRLLPRSAKGQLLAYEQSGRLLNTDERSVSYAAMAFYDTAKEPLAPGPPRSLIPLAYFAEEPKAPAPQAPGPPKEEGATGEETVPQDDAPEE